MSAFSCPQPSSPNETIQLGHGSGGVLTHRLLEEHIFPAFDNRTLRTGHDSAVLAPALGRLAFTTDSYVVRPRFFPGGDIGALAAIGTINDLAMSGACPRWMSVSLILEEGLPIKELDQILASLGEQARAAGVEVVTGDTKVVDRGHGDGLYVNTSGVGVIEHDLDISPGAIREGDRIILSGDLGRHGVCILSEREGLAFDSTIESDAAPLHGPALALLDAGLPVHCLRDLTRGGLASALKELMLAAGLSAEIRELDIPIDPVVRGACELLGLDPLYVASEGRMVAIVPADAAEATIETFAKHPETASAVEIGRVTAGSRGELVLESQVGTRRIVEMLPGAQLPRIC